MKKRCAETLRAAVGCPRKPRPCRLRLEALEDRLTPSGLDPIREDPQSNPGTLVRDLIDRSGSAGAAGVAITDLDQSNGTWQFAADGKTWMDVGAVSPNEARLLLGDTDTRLRFVPNEDFDLDAALQFRTWDGTGTEGTVADTFAGTGFGLDFEVAGIDVEAVNDPPLALSDELPGSFEGEGRLIDVEDLLANDVAGPEYEDEQTLTIVAVDGVRGGTFSLDGDEVVYVPGEEFSGLASFSYVVSDGAGGRATGAARFFVERVLSGSAIQTALAQKPPFTSGGLPFKPADLGEGSQPPLIPADEGSESPPPDQGGLTGELNAIEEDVADASNRGTSVFAFPFDQFYSSSSLAITDVDDSNGTWQFTLDNGETWTDFPAVSPRTALLLRRTEDTLVRFRPQANFNGTAALQFRNGFAEGFADGSRIDTDARDESFEFRVQGRMTIRVREVNDEPTAFTDQLGPIEGDSPIFLTFDQLLQNDSRGPDNESDQSLIPASVESVAGGVVTLNDEGVIVFEPAPGFEGQARFRYTISDNGTSNGESDSLSATGIVVFDVVNQFLPGNAAPIAEDDAYVISQGQPLTASVLLNDSDADGDPLSVVLTSLPSHGTLSIDASGAVLYLPDAGFCGTDTFSYLVNDGDLDSNVATVSITVLAAPVPDDPPPAPEPPAPEPPTPATENGLDPTLVPPAVALLPPGALPTNAPPIVLAQAVAPFAAPRTTDALRSSFTHGGGDQPAPPPEPLPSAAATPDSELSASVLPGPADGTVLPGERLARPPKEAFLTGTGDEVDPVAQHLAGPRIASLGESILDDSPDVKHFEQALQTVHPEQVPVKPVADEEVPIEAPAPQQQSGPVSLAPESVPPQQAGFSVTRLGVAALLVLGATARAGVLGGRSLAGWLRRGQTESPPSRGFFARWFSRNT